MSESSNQVKGNRLDPWLDSYAARAHGLRASETRSLFAVASRPEVVSLAGGMPNLKDLPLERLAEATSRMIREDGGRALQYGNGQGMPQLREQITEVMALEGIRADPEDVIVTTGSQQAVDIVTELFVDPGDVVLTEAPTYVGSLSIFATYQADVQQVPIDAGGIIPEALEEVIVRLEREGRRIKFFYCLPNFHNPAGVTLTEERRPRVIEICRRHHILIVEDNPYGLLGFKGQTYTALKTLAPDDVVYRSCARRRWASSRSPCTWSSSSGSGRSWTSDPCTRSGATPWYRRWKSSCPCVNGTSPTAASTCGSGFQRDSTPRTCCHAQSPAWSLTSPVQPSTPEVGQGRTICDCPSAIPSRPRSAKGCDGCPAS